MVKDMGTRNAGSQDTLRLFNRALEVLASPAPESEQELLDLVKKAKRDADKDHPPAPTAVKKPSRICVFPLCLLVVISTDAFSLSLERRLSSTRFYVQIVFDVFLLLPGRGVAEVKDFQALGHRPSPGALTADHVSRSSFSVGRTRFYDLV
jgi:hypothetical protein